MTSRAGTVSLKFAGCRLNVRLMSDCEDFDSLWQSWRPAKGKRKKPSMKDKNSSIMEENARKSKKKKNSKFKDAMEARKDKRKTKKKKKKKQKLVVSVTPAEPETLNPQPRVEPKLDKKKKKKKKVAFDISTDPVRVRRPKSLLEVHNEVQTQESISDDVNSQDLFITQKTFRPSPSQPSSSEATGLYLLTPQEVPPSGVWTHPKDSQNTVKVPGDEEEQSSSRQVPREEPGASQVSRDSRPNPDLENSATQTENFFTAELCSYFHFRRSNASVDLEEEVKPLDLSLPRGTRRDPAAETRTGPDRIHHKDPDLQTVSPQSESENKSADTTASSEDEPLGRTSKLDMSQVRAVQMRLNESFFFKAKGETQSPRPESPLMKLVQGRDRKTRKHR